MDMFLTVVGSVIVLVVITRFMIGKNRTRELDRDFSLELSCGRERALMAAATAARGVLWQVEFTDNGLRTRHIRDRNVISVAISDHPGQQGRSCAKIWTRCTWADAVLILRPRSYLDTRRKRDKIIRALSEYTSRSDRDATIG